MKIKKMETRTTETDQGRAFQSFFIVILQRNHVCQWTWKQTGAVIWALLLKVSSVFTKSETSGKLLSLPLSAAWNAYVLTGAQQSDWTMRRIQGGCCRDFVGLPPCLNWWPLAFYHMRKESLWKDEGNTFRGLATGGVPLPQNVRTLISCS